MTPGRLIAYGHSWAFGTGSSDGERGFCLLAARALRLRPDLRAVSGSLSTETARLVATSPPPPAHLFVLMTGLNDARRCGRSPAGREAYADALALVLHAFASADPTAPVLALEQPHLGDYSGYAPFSEGSDAVIDAYNTTLRQVATRYPSTRVVTVESWAVDTMVAADGVHPNDAGHRHLARAVVRAVAAADVSPAG